jgi:MFS family permease
VLLISRLLQGVASAILYTVGLAVLVESVNKDEVGRYMGSAMSCNSFGIILSPLLGGVLYKAAGKNAVLGVMMGVSAIDIAFRLTIQEPTRKSRDSSSDLFKQKQQISDPEKGSKTDTTHLSVEKLEPGASSFSLITSSSQTQLLSNGEMIKELPSIEKDLSTIPNLERKPLPTSRFVGILKLIRSPRLLAALYGIFINECIVTSLCAILPIFVYDTFHWKSLESGFSFLTIAIPGLAGPLAGLLSDKLGPRPVALAGFLLTTPSLVALQFVHEDSIRQVVLLCVLLTLAGMYSSY